MNMDIFTSRCRFVIPLADISFSFVFAFAHAVTSSWMITVRKLNRYWIQTGWLALVRCTRKCGTHEADTSLHSTRQSNSTCTRRWCRAILYSMDIICISDHLHCMNCCATVRNTKFDTGASTCITANGGVKWMVSRQRNLEENTQKWT